MEYDIESGGDPEIRNQIIDRIIRKYQTVITPIFAGFFNQVDRKDAIQDFYTKFCSKSINDLVEIENNGKPYMYGMAKNHCIDIIRKRKRTTDFIDEITTESGGIRGINDEAEIYKRMIIAIQTIIIKDYGDKVATIITLKINGFSSKEIAQRIGVTPGSIDTRWHRLIKDPHFVNIIKNAISSI
ncbi:MAG: sigma-70 family RNA polymerase sigma factor [Bacteroidota bacterium]